MTLNGSADSPLVSFTLSGGGKATNSADFSIISAGFDLTDGFNPFPAEINGDDFGNIPIVSGGGTWSNESNDNTLEITALFLQDSSMFNTVDRFGVVTTESYIISEGDLLSWEGSGIIDLSNKGLVFGDLNKGVGIGEFVVPIYGSLLTGKLIVGIPEPTATLFWTGCICLFFRRQKRGSFPHVQISFEDDEIDRSDV